MPWVKGPGYQLVHIDEDADMKRKAKGKGRLLAAAAPPTRTLREKQDISGPQTATAAAHNAKPLPKGKKVASSAPRNY